MSCCYLLNVITTHFIVSGELSTICLPCCFMMGARETATTLIFESLAVNFDHYATIKQTTVWQKGQVCEGCVCDSVSHSLVCFAQVLILTASIAKQHRGAYITHTRTHTHTHRSSTNHTLITSEWKKLSSEVCGSGLLQCLHQADSENVKRCWWLYSRRL